MAYRGLTRFFSATEAINLPATSGACRRFVLFHLRDRAGDASAVDVVAGGAFFARGGKAGADVAGHDGAYAHAHVLDLVKQRHGVGVDRRLGDGIPRLKGNRSGAATLLMLTMRPPPCARMGAMAAFEALTAPKRLTSSRRCASAFCVNSAAPEMPKPALLTKMSSRPSRLTTSPTAARACASSETSQQMCVRPSRCASRRLST